MSAIRKDSRTDENLYEWFLRVDENGLAVATETGWFCLNQAEQDEVYEKLKAIRSEL